MRLIAIDVETAAQGHICEIGCAEIADRQIVKVCGWLVKPSCFPNFDPEHQTIHNIIAADLENAPTFKELWDAELHKIIRPDALLIAHHAWYDVEAITTEMKRNEIKMFPVRYFCTLQQARKHLKGLDGYSLKNVCRFMKIQQDNPHRAESDAVSAARIFIKLPKTHAGGIKIKQR